MDKKKILITGKGSYIGTSFIKWLEQWPERYEIDEISVRGTKWKDRDFSHYDVVLHVAGIAHVSADPKMKEEYYRVNRDLAIEIATKAKEEHVKQFIFMSSMLVYGSDNNSLNQTIINKDTVTGANDFYGRSKLEADKAIQQMNDREYKVACIRTPMVYGPGCKGNFPKLIKFSKWSPIFPKLNNKRSMIYIDNLCEFIKLNIDYNDSGLFFPQNKEYVSTVNIVETLVKFYGRKIIFTSLFNWIILIFLSFSSFMNKIFGDKIYEKELSTHYDWQYCLVDFEKSIKHTLWGK
ncbi:NAD-dependent epimerase/dehydratase family protein [Paenibacillus tepidiphilus]|uniref:NAD-dependent epimerase/dehydratase family protein n=1 Tax=Paenibacillus tepidiphilus TaxID=2608683 RepID=UPI00123906E6|nr:NAD-dependent epimerase/dehydratase family protein [Paenibacillus tepidiphilus]